MKHKFCVKMVAFSRLNSRARVMFFTAISVMTIRRNKQLYKKKASAKILEEVNI